MFSKFATRREFLNCGKLSLLFFLNSCSNLPNKLKIALQNSFYPESFKDTIPKDWKQEKINFENIQLQKNRNTIFNSDFTLINDGWISSIDFSEFEKINEYALFENLDKRSIDFLGSFNQNQRSKLFPIGVVPYTIIIKNNKELINSAKSILVIHPSFIKVKSELKIVFLFFCSRIFSKLIFSCFQSFGIVSLKDSG